MSGLFTKLLETESFRAYCINDSCKSRKGGPQLRNRAMRNGLLSQTTNPGMQPPGFPTDVIALK